MGSSRYERAQLDVTIFIETAPVARPSLVSTSNHQRLRMSVLPRYANRQVMTRTGHRSLLCARWIISRRTTSRGGKWWLVLFAAPHACDGAGCELHDLFNHISWDLSTPRVTVSWDFLDAKEGSVQPMGHRMHASFLVHRRGLLQYVPCSPNASGGHNSPVLTGEDGV